MTVARNDSGLRLVGLGVEPPLWMRLQVVKLLELLNGGQLDSRVRRRREENHQTRTLRRGGDGKSSDKCLRLFGCSCAQTCV